MLNEIVKPALAETIAPTMEETLSLIPWQHGWEVSTKLDGLRCTCVDGGGQTRKGQEMKNKSVAQRLREHAADFRGLDNELGVMRNGTICFKQSLSELKRFEGEPDFHMFVFDDWTCPGAYSERIAAVEERVRDLNLPWVHVIPHQIISVQDLAVQELRKALNAGHEGLIVRDPAAEYKNGRYTAKSLGMVKVKPYRDGPGLIVGVEQRRHNANEAETDPFGHTKRSSAKAGKKPLEEVGTLLVEMPNFKGTCRCGTGWNKATAKAWYADPKQIVGKTMHFKWLAVGEYDAPRNLVYLGAMSDAE